MTSTTAQPVAANSKARKERASVLAPMKTELQQALFSALTTGNNQHLELKVRELVGRDATRAKQAWEEVIDPIRTSETIAPQLASLLTSLATVVEPAGKIPNVTRVGKRRALLVLPNAPGLEDVGAVRVSTVENKGPDGRMKTLIVLEPITENEYAQLIGSVATVHANPALNRAA